MSSVFFSQFGIDEVGYFVAFLKEHIGEYKLHELTSGYCPDLPAIENAHPLALEYGNMLAASTEGSNNWTSILPAIGVEFLDDNEFDRQLLGAGNHFIDIPQSFLDEVEAVKIADRKDSGILMADKSLKTIQDMLDAKDPGEKLYAKVDRYIQNQAIVISIWSNHIDATRYTYLVVRSLLKRAKRDLSARGIKNLSINGQGAIYNYEFGTTLFGAEFHLNFISPCENIEVIDTLEAIKGVEEASIDVQKPGMEGPKGEVKFVPIGKKPDGGD